MRALGRAVIVAGQVVVALLALWTIGWLATGDSHAAIRAGLYLTPFMLIGAAALALGALLLRRRAAALVAAAVAVTLGAAAPASLTRLAAAPDAPALTLTALSNRTQNRDMAATARAMRAHRADIFVLQEIADPRALMGGLTGLYSSGRQPDHCIHGNFVILSRFPVGPAARLAGGAAMRCIVALHAGDAAVYSIHLPRALRDGRDQTRAIAAVLADAARQPATVIVAGDFNATPLTGTMQLAGRSLVNAFDRAGRGPGFTFPTPARRLGALGPFLRIDHVLMGNAFRPTSARAARWHPPLADHFPVEIGFSDLRGESG